MKRHLIVACVCLAALVSPAAADCISEQQRLEQSVADLNSWSGQMGICQMARAAANLYTQAAEFHEQCAPGPAGSAQAQEYHRAAQAAHQTANASCQ